MWKATEIAYCLTCRWWSWTGGGRLVGGGGRNRWRFRFWVESN